MLVLSVVDSASRPPSLSLSEPWWRCVLLVWLVVVEDSSVCGWGCAAALVEVWSVVGSTEFAFASAAAAVAEGADDSVEMKMESTGEAEEDEADAEADTVLTKMGVPVRLIGMTVRPLPLPPEEMSVVMADTDASLGAGLEDSAAADALAGIVDGAAEPVTVRTPVWGAGWVGGFESVLGWGGMIIVSDACDGGAAGADVAVEVVAAAEAEAEAEGGNGEAWIEDKPFEISALVDVSCAVMASVTLAVVVVDTSVAALTGMEVRPGSKVSLSVTENDDSLSALVAAALSTDAELDDVLSGIELSPLTILSAPVCAAGAVPLSWFRCAVSLSVVYPPTGPLKVCEAVTKTMVILLGDDTLGLDSGSVAVSAAAELLAGAVGVDTSELDGEAVEAAAAIGKGASVLEDAVLLAVSEGGNAADT